MKNRIILGCFAMLLLCCGQFSWAISSKNPQVRPGHLFNVAAYVNTLTISTSTPDWTYPKAGIQVLTPGYTVANLPNDNGFYLFSVSDKSPATINLVGAPGEVSIKLCLRAVGSGANCETQTLTLSSQKYAFIASGFTGNVYKCHVNANGSLSRCEIIPLSGAPAWIPESLAFATVNGVEYAYVASWQDGIVYQCTLTGDKSFDVCNVIIPTGTIYLNAAGISFATVNGIQYAYVSDGFLNVYHCSLNNNGTFNVCNPTPVAGTPAWIPVSTSFAIVNGTQYAYVASDDTHAYQCTLNANGTFNTCNILTPNSGNPNWLPKAITFATFNGQQFAYVADDNSNVFQCSLNADGTFNVCTTTPLVGEPDWIPRAISFQTINGTQYAYVANYGTGVSLIGSIFQCNVDNEGRFSNCIDTPEVGVPNWGNLWWVAFNP